MELYDEINVTASRHGTKPFELQCFIALTKIKNVLEDSALNDYDCFQRIEEIVLIYEEMGIKIKSRHDF